MVEPLHTVGGHILEDTAQKATQHEDRERSLELFQKQHGDHGARPVDGNVGTV